MKTIKQIILSTFIIILTFANVKGADLCYDTPVSSGGLLCLGILDIGGCKITTPIRNISSSTITGVTVIKAYSGIDISLIDAIGIDEASKTPNKDSDEAEVSNTLNQYTNLNGIVDLNIFNMGVVYRTNDYAPSSSTSTADQHTIYTKTFVGFSLSDLKYLASYTKNGIEYNTRLYPCSQKLVTLSPSKSIAEGNTSTTTPADFTVTLSEKPTVNKLYVDYTITAGTATQGTDYSSSSYSGTLTFNKNTSDLTQTIPVSIIGDDTNESNETFFVNLTSLSQSSSENFEIDDSFKKGTVTIINDDNGSGGVTPPISSAYANVDVVNGYSGSGVGYTSWINTKISAEPNIQLSAVYLGNNPNNPVPQAYMPSGHANQDASITILYKLADMSGGATCQNAPTVNLKTTLGGDTPVISVIDPGETTQISNAFVIGYVQSGTTPLAKKDVRVKYKSVDFNKLINDSGIQCAQKSSTNSVAKGIPACLVTNGLDSQVAQNYKTVFGEEAFNNCYTENGQPCYASNGGIGAAPYDHEYGCYECSIEAFLYICSNDNFAIRPNNFDNNITANQLFTAGVSYPLTFNANQFGGIGTAAYNENEHTSFVVDANVSNSSKVCQEMSINFTPDINFTDGTVTNNYMLNNVGDFNVTMHEIVGAEYALVDADDTNESIRLITPSTKQIRVVPDHFSVDGNLTNGSNGFTYLSNFQEYNTTQSRTVSASLDLNVSARRADNSVTSNYTSQCYAKDGNITLTLTNAINVTPPASDGNAPLSKIVWYHNTPDINGSLDLNTTALEYKLPFAYTQFDSNETNGTGIFNYKINFDRNITKVVNPFMVVVTNMNLIDVNGISGINSVDSNATFLYGRTHAARQRYDVPADAPYTANIYFETYCFGAGCTKILLPNGAASERVDDVRWFINKNHNSLLDGVTGAVTQKGGAGIVSATSPNYTLTYKPTTNLTYNGSRGYPYRSTMENNASNWLIQNEYNPNATTNEFPVEFDRAGDWSGEHETNTTTKSIGGVKTNRRISW